MGVVVYAKDNPSSFFVDSPQSLEERGESQSRLEKRAAGKIKGIDSEEIGGLAESQFIERSSDEKKEQANFFEAATSKISEKKNNMSEKVTAVVSCIDEADQKDSR